MVSNKKGFTVVELVIVVATILVMFAIISKGFGRMYRWYEKAETMRNLDIIKNGLTEYYKARAYKVDGTSSDVLVVSTASGTTTIPNNVYLKDYKTAVSMLARTFIGLSMKDIEFDGFGTPYKFYVTDRLGNGNIQYRNIVVVSAGPNKKFETTFNPTTGAVNIGGDDIAVVVTGGDIEFAKYQETLNKMQKYVNYLENSFSIAFASDPTRNVMVDHFINRRRNGTQDQYVDTVDGFNNTCIIDPSTCLARPDQLGITLSANSSIEDETNAWYYPGMSSSDLQNVYIYIDDDSNNVRSPDSPENQPPYSAHVVTRTPWGTTITLTALGSVS